MLIDEIKSFKKVFKLNNEYLNIHKIYSSYIANDGRKIFDMENDFISLSTEIQANYIAGMKKILSGPAFKKTHLIELNTLDKDNLVGEELNYLVESFDEKYIINLEENILKNFKYEKDIFINVIQFQLNDFNFIACLMCPVKPGNVDVLIDLSDPKMRTECVTNKIIKFESPVDGFIYPAYIQDNIDTNHAFYYTSQSKNPNISLIQNVFNDTILLNSEEEKDRFSVLLSSLLDNSCNIEKIAHLYDVLEDKILMNADSLDCTLNKNELISIFRGCNIEIDEDHFNKIYDEVIESIPLNISNLIPNNKSEVSSDLFKLKINKSLLKELNFIEDNTGIYIKIPLSTTDNIVSLDGIEISPSLEN